MRIQHEHLRVGDGMPNGHGICNIADFVNHGPNRGFGRSVHVPQLSATRQELHGKIGRERFASAENLQSRGAVPSRVDKRPPGGRRGLHHSAGRFADALHELRGIVRFLARGDHQLAAGNQRQVQLEAGDVERERGDRQQDVF